MPTKGVEAMCSSRRERGRSGQIAPACSPHRYRAPVSPLGPGQGAPCARGALLSVRPSLPVASQLK